MGKSDDAPNRNRGSQRSEKRCIVGQRRTAQEVTSRVLNRYLMIMVVKDSAQSILLISADTCRKIL
jgi:hypothetical protein